MNTGDIVPPALATARVLDREGRAWTLGDAWSRGPALVCFLRHFGCSGCSEHVTELSPHLAMIAQLGVRAVLVGNGEPRQIAGFVARLGLSDKKVEVATDPTLFVFRAAGLERSLLGTIGPRALADKLRVSSKGHKLEGIQGDLLQQGGALAVDADGRVAFYHRSVTMGGHAKPAVLLDVVLALAARKSPVGC